MSIQTRLTGIVTGVYVGDRPGTLVSSPQDQVVVDFAGFVGDQHAGLTRKSDSRTPHYSRGTEIRNDRQVSLVSVEELAQVSGVLGLPALPAEWLGANLLLSGIPGLSLLPPTTRLFFAGGVVLAVSGINHPCTQAGRAIQSQSAALGETPVGLAEWFPKAARNLRGIVAVVERPGVLCKGEPVEARIPDIAAYPV